MKLKVDTIIKILIGIEIYQSKSGAWTSHYLCIIGQAGPKEWSGLGVLSRGGAETSQSGGGVRPVRWQNHNRWVETQSWCIAAGPLTSRSIPQIIALLIIKLIMLRCILLLPDIGNTIVICFENPVFWFGSTWGSLKEKVPKWLCFEQCCMVDILIN